MKRLTAIFSILLVFAVAGIMAQEKAANPDTEAIVPALDAFHEIIYPIWHTAYPEKDVAALMGFVPKINELAAKVYAAKLPGILREKEAKWKAGLAEFKSSVDAYNSAAADQNGDALLKAAEDLHMRYEMLVRTIRPVLPQMDAFHKVLYVVYHTYLPGKNWDEIRKAAPELDAKAEAVTKATLSKRLEAKTADFAAAAAGLKAATAELAGLGAGADGKALDKAVEKIHTKYQALEKIFD